MLKRAAGIIRPYILDIVILLCVFSLFFFLRLYSLKTIPIFVDEAIYARWAQQGVFDPSLRLISLVDGKHPFYIWLVTLVMNFIYNPIIAARLVSVAAGFLSMIGLYLLSFELFRNRWVSIICVSLYAMYPFALVIDRLGLYESLLGAFHIWALYLAIALVRNASLGLSLSLALVLGAGLLTKSSGILNLYLIPLTLLLFDFTKENIKRLPKWVFYVALAYSLAFIYHSIIFLSDKHYMIAAKNTLFMYRLSELIPYNAFQKWPQDSLQLLQWAFIYVTYPLAVLGLSFLFVKSKFRKEKLFLFACFFIPLAGLGLFGRTLNPRYLFPITLYLLPLGAIAIYELRRFAKNKVFYSIIIFVIVGNLFFSNFKILTDMSHAPIPEIDQQQYVNGYSSGEGLRQIVAFLQKEAADKQIIIATEGIWGSLPTTVIEIYFAHNELVEKYAFETRPKTLPENFHEKSSLRPVYIIFNETQTVGRWPVELIMRFRRGSGNLYLSLYRLKTPDLVKNSL